MMMMMVNCIFFWSSPTAQRGGLAFPSSLLVNFGENGAAL
jgi:hypothetical protein